MSVKQPATSNQIMLKQLRSLKVSERQAVALAVCSGIVLLALIVAWLGISTRTAIVNQELSNLTTQDLELTDKINDTWTEIGRITAQDQMEQRARQAGFRSPDETEYYAVMTATLTAALSPTVPTTTTEMLISPEITGSLAITGSLPITE